MKKVTFITTGQPTSNPRLVKEVDTLLKLGYQVKVVYCFYYRWAQQFDHAITSKHPGTYLFCGGEPVIQKLVYLKTKIRQRLFQKLWRYFNVRGVAEGAISRAHHEALLLAKKNKSDLYIAHNLGALPSAVLAAKYHRAKVGYDAEDLHSGQYTSTTDNMYRLNKYIEEEYFPYVDYFSAASPLIADHYQKMYSYLRPVLINNVFPKTNLPPPENRQNIGSLKLFWFSQTVGMHRGLELVIKAMALTHRNIQLHLLGSCSADDFKTLTELGENSGLQPGQIQFYEPIQPDDLFAFATQFDIGMASETGETLNRDICLTNKIFTYIQCGLAVLASDTQAQQLFMAQYPPSGLLYDKKDEQMLSKQLADYFDNPDRLFAAKLYNYQLGQTRLNWEVESDQFTALIKMLD